MITFPYENLSCLKNRLTLFLRIRNKRCILENSFSVGIPSHLLHFKRTTFPKELSLIFALGAYLSTNARTIVS